MNDKAVLQLLESLAEKIDALASALDRPTKRFLTVSNAALDCDLSEESIRRMIAAGKLTALRPVRGRILVDREELNTVIKSSTTRPRTGRGIQSK